MSLFGTSYSKEKVLKSAEKYVQQGKLDAAIKEYKRILEVEPQDLKVVSSLAELHSRSNQTREAVALFLRIAEHYERTSQIPQAIAMYRRIFKMDINNYPAAVTLAELYRQQGNLPEAVQFYLGAASACRRTNQIPTAIKMAREAVSLDPESIRARVELAGVLHLSEEYDEAHDLYVQAGREFLRKGQNNEGLECFRKAMLVKPGSKPALKALTDISLQMGDAKGAVRMVKQLLLSNPQDVDLLILLGRTCLGGSLLDDAEEAFTTLVQLDPQRYEYLLEVGRQFLKIGMFDRTIQTVQKCAEHVVARGQKKKATAILKQVIQLDPNHLTAMQVLADVYDGARERQQATMVMQAIKPDEDFEDDLDQYNYSTELLESMVQQNPAFAQARIKMLEDMAVQQPDYLEVWQQLRQNYLDSQLKEKAAKACLELARIQLARGNQDASEASKAEAYELDPGLRPVRPMIQVAEGESIPLTDIMPDVGIVANVVASADAGVAEDDQTVALKALPGTFNRYLTVDKFQKRYESLWTDPIYSTEPLSLIKIQVDNFVGVVEENEEIRESYLQPIAETLHDEVKTPNAYIAYCGNATFFAFFPKVHPETIEHLAESMRSRIESLWLPHPASDDLDWVTASIATVTAIPRQASPTVLISVVNSGLTNATSRGGNVVVTYGKA
ncbi:MAG: tetratricopeptide repeat protein [Acidobacteria bacterium]|nr:tetratricopeptide repeat protein [Acidobacteriota bacterium]